MFYFLTWSSSMNLSVLIFHTHIYTQIYTQIHTHTQIHKHPLKHICNLQTHPQRNTQNALYMKSCNLSRLDYIQNWIWIDLFMYVGNTLIQNIHMFIYKHCTHIYTKKVYAKNTKIIITKNCISKKIFTNRNKVNGKLGIFNVRIFTVF